MKAREHLLTYPEITRAKEFFAKHRKEFLSKRGLIPIKFEGAICISNNNFPSDPAIGDIFYHITSQVSYVFDGKDWLMLGY